MKTPETKTEEHRIVLTISGKLKTKPLSQNLGVSFEKLGTRGDRLQIRGLSRENSNTIFFKLRAMTKTQDPLATGVLCFEVQRIVWKNFNELIEFDVMQTEVCYRDKDITTRVHPVVAHA